jgi:hypothetical protein
MAHAKDFGFGPTRGFLVEAQRTTVEPIRTRVVVVSKRKPQTFELADFLPMLAMPKIYDVRDAQCLKFFNVAPGGHRAAKRQPLAYPKHLHAVAPFVRT